MSFMNDVLSAGSFGESDRLDVVVRHVDILQARYEALSALLVAKGVLTAEEVAALSETPAVSNEELDRLDVRIP
jgi:hypothetical protein